MISIEKTKESCLSAWMVACLIALLAIVGVACSDDDENDTAPISVAGVYLEDAESSVPDRKVDFARLGQVIRIEGQGFAGMRKVYINGLETYFNPVYVSDHSMLLSVSKNTPVVEADPSVRNTIRLVKSGTEQTFPFTIRAAAPSIDRISHTMPLAGESITVYGSGLHEIVKVTFPGEVVVTENIVSDEDGAYFVVTVPQAVSENGGSIFAEGANGGAYSPAYFNYRKGLLLDFDGTGAHGHWGSNNSMIKPEDLFATQIGEGNVSQGTYCRIPAVKQLPAGKGKNRVSEVWTGGNGVDPDWLTLGIDGSTPVANCAIQFDIYVPEAWAGSGFLKVCGQNGFNGGEWERDCYNYIPWLVNGKVVPFQTTGWQTVTVPFSAFYKSKASSDAWTTFADVAATRAAASYQNFGFFFENSSFKLSQVTGNAADETEFPAEDSTVEVYIDNWRVVPLAKPVYTDFPENE